MIANTSLPGRYLKTVARSGSQAVARARPLLAGQMLLPLAMAACAALGAIHVQGFVTKYRVLAAGVVPAGVAISDGEQSYLVSEAELDALLTEVERLS